VILHRERLAGVDPRLASVVNALKFDAAVVCGVRDKEAQDLAVAEKRSKTPWPLSKHNVGPEREFSEAVDLCPYPVDWSNERAFYVLAGAVLQEARTAGIPLRWGGDWSGDGVGDEKDDRFPDLGHFELKRVEV
jgi:peptidoglycan L-alanyl-D-glutamate endopeptidase CwlK